MLSRHRQEERLISLYMYGEIDDDYIRRKSGPLRQKRHGLEKELEELGRQKRTLEQIELAEDRVQEFCQRVRGKLARLDFQDRQRALEALSIRVTAYRDRIEIPGAFSTYVTTARTWACMFNQDVGGVPFQRPAVDIRC